MSVDSVRALAFDVFGTLVDWRSSVAAEVVAMALPVDPGAFADGWRRKYRPAMDRVRRGELPWTSLDALNRAALDELLAEHRIAGLPEERVSWLNLVWHRLLPWPDSPDGLQRLRRRYLTATLSNGGVRLLADLARVGELHFDVILSAELFQHYKPDQEVYLGAAALLDVEPREVMMVAAHPDDLRAAARAGLRTAFISRPLEWGAQAEAVTVQKSDFDLVAFGLDDLAAQLEL